MHQLSEKHLQSGAIASLNWILCKIRTGKSAHLAVLNSTLVMLMETIRFIDSRKCQGTTVVL